MEINRKVLSDALTHLVKVVPKKSTMYILKNVHIQCEAKKATLTVTDLKTWVQFTLPYTGDPINTCVDAAVLYKLVNIGTDKNNTVKIDENGDDCSIICDGARSRLKANSIDLYPSISVNDCVEIGSLISKEFVKASKFIVPAVSTNLTRSHINCVSFQGRRMIATDGHRMHYWDCPESTGLSGVTSMRLTGVKMLVNLAKKDTGKITFYQDDTHIKCSVGDWMLVSKTPDGNFPPYEQLIPRCHEHIILCSAAPFKAMIVKALSLTERNGAGKFIINGKKLILEIFNEGQEMTLDCDLQESDFLVEYVIGFNLRYIFDMLACTDIVTMTFSGPLGPLVFHGDSGEFAVVMPMRVG